MHVPQREAFEFFAEPGNLERITPPSLGFRFLVEPPKRLKVGATLEYRIRVHGVPVRWRTRIEVWEPPDRFVDLQTSGPYAYWRHSHAFTRSDSGGTVMSDRVEFAMPLWPLGELAYVLFVARDLRRIFDYRAARIPDLVQRRHGADRT